MSVFSGYLGFERARELRAQNTPPTELSERLADLALAIDFATLPPAAVDAAKLAILDAVGVSLAGWNDPVATMAVDHASASYGSGRGGVIGCPLRLTPCGAALANGTLIHALDFDDTAWSYVGHPSAVFLPAAFAVAEQTGASGGELVAAYVAAFEVASYLGQPLARTLASRGWHLTSVIGIFGAAAAAGKLLGFEREKLKMAFGLAATQASGLKANFGWPAKPIHAGFAARDGVEAALLVERGLTASPDIFEHSSGFHVAFAGYRPEIQKRQALAIVEDTISFKRYPCCTGSHAAVDALLELRREHALTAEDIERVVCTTTPEVAAELVYPMAETVSQARFSMNFALSVALVYGTLGLDQFNRDALSQPAVRDLMGRCKTIYRELDRPFGVRAPAAEVELRLVRGDTVTKRIECAKGNPQDPLTAAELTEKFEDCASRRLEDKGQVRALGELVRTLEDVDDVSQVTALANPFRGRNAR